MFDSHSEAVPTPPERSGPFTLDRRARTGSTNDDAAALLGDPAHAGTTIVADYQTAGRGRKARRWVATPGSALLFTAILPEPIPAGALWAATFWAALGVARGVRASTGIELELQWPNDLLSAGKKVCGILCVSRVAGDRAWLGCGVGLNVTRPEGENERSEIEAIVPPPAFLCDARDDGTPLNRDTILIAILEQFAASLGGFDAPRTIARDWEARANLAGTPYRLLCDGDAEPFEARARRLDDDGALIVIDAGGRERSISLADARVLRA